MASAWSDLKDGVLRKFCFLEVVLAGHARIARNNSSRDAEATFMGFLEFIEKQAKAHGGQTWNLAGDGGLFAFCDDDVTVMAAQGVNSALAILAKLPDLNATRSKVKEEVRVQIAVHMGDACYYHQTGRIQSDDISFVSNLGKRGTAENSVSLSNSVYRELAEEAIRSRFRGSVTFEENYVYVLEGTEGTPPSLGPKVEPAPAVFEGIHPQEVPVGRAFLRVGREEDNDIQYDVPVVSRHHAIVYRAEQGYHLYDLASTNHTYVDGQIVAFAAISAQNQVTLGRSQVLDFSELDRQFAKIEVQGGGLAEVDIVRFGSALDNEIVLGDPEVADYQGIIRKCGGQVFIYDAQIPARMRINSQPVNHGQIRPADRVMIGRAQQLLWSQIAKAFEERRTPHGKRSGSTGKTNVLAGRLRDLIRQQQETQRRNRNIAIAAGGIILVLLIALGIQLQLGGDRLSEAAEKNRSAVVMVIRKDAPAETASTAAPKSYADIGGIRMEVFSDTGANGLSYGSGFLCEYRDGSVVITNRHVAQAEEGRTVKLTVRLQGLISEYDVEVLKIHPTQDVAILGFRDPPPGITGVELDSEWQRVRDGDPVALMSFPLGMQGQESAQIKADLIKGNISNRLYDHIKYTLASAPGASGGPIFNQDGKVIAINRGGSIDETGRHYQGLNWGIPIRAALELLHSKQDLGG